MRIAVETRIAIIGTVGVPGRYGGFETLVENLVNYHSRTNHRSTLTVWCSGKGGAVDLRRFKSADLRYVNLHANGWQSIPYDVVCLWQAIRSGHKQVLLLGVSGALALPIIRLISQARIVTNIDGIEWKRKKWGHLARAVLRISEWAAVRFSHEIIADNVAIAHYVRDIYGAPCHVIAYGGDHSVAHAAEPEQLPADLPKRYALAICRIEPENNVDTILEAWEDLASPLVFVGNWSHSAYGRDLFDRYSRCANIFLLNPIYATGALRALRERASIYIHGHSAGGTNPSLIEMMHFRVAVLAYNCVFNRFSTEDKALYFKNADGLAALVRGITEEDKVSIGNAMHEIAVRRYTWDQIGDDYFALLHGA